MGVLMFSYIESSSEENKEFLNEYVNSLSSKFDTFLEENILKTKIYSIYNEGTRLGYFGIYDKTMRIQFFMPVSNLVHAQNTQEKC